jgi:four helix bundle protein
MRPKTRALLDRLIGYGIGAIKAARSIRSEIGGDHLARQLVRSSTSIAANYAEGCEAESRADFVHKLKLALKEARESEVWLRTIAGLRSSESLSMLAKENDEIIAILVKSIATSEARSRTESRRKRLQ